MHVSIAGGLPKALERAHALGCTTFQIFSHSPRSWYLSGIPEEEARLFRAERERLALDPVFIHACYLLNLSSENTALRERSVWMLEEEMRRAGAIGADYVIIHSGRAADNEDNSGANILFMEAVKSVLGTGGKGKKKNKKFGAGLLLENTAVAPDPGRPPGSVKALARMALEAGAAGICLDTCHAFASGYDISTEDGLELLARQTRGVKVSLIHMNDSKGRLGSGMDRHEHLGKGAIGLEGFRNFLGFGPPFSGVPVIMETPKKKEEDDPSNIKTIKELLGTDRKG